MQESFAITPQEALHLGWSIIPTNRNKTPMIQWKTYQERKPTTDELEKWLQMKPPAWALVTGSISGRITLDFDGKEGCETLKDLDIPPHRSTPSGGFHADFLHPGWHVSSLNGKSKIELGKRWPGLDIRGDGGYALFAGETNQGRYNWMSSPEAHSLATLPPELQNFLGPPKKNGSSKQPNSHSTATATTLAEMALARIPSHGRNNSGFWLAAQLRDGQFSEEDALITLKLYRSRCPPTNRKGEEEEYTEAEMLSSLEQAYNRGARDPWNERKKKDPDKTEPKHQRHFTVGSKGVFFVDEESESKLFICSRLDVEAYARDINSESWGRLLKWHDLGGKPHTWIVPMRMLVGDGVQVRETLADGGVDIGTAPKTNHLLAQYIRTERPERFMFCVPFTGWFDRSFVMPESVIPEKADVGYQSTGRGEHFYRTSGTLESWKEEIGKKCIGNSRLIFAVSAALAGPLLRPLNVQGGGFHFRGTSSMGKSTTQWVAGSVWGGGGRNGFARTWATTKTALETIAELHNDGCLILDEIRMIDPKEVEQIVYMLANGSGKARENRNMTGRRTLQWQLMILSSGEIPLSDCAALAGQKIKGGAEIRMATIPADCDAGMGIFEQLHGTDDPRIFAETLEAAAKLHYGCLSRAQLEYIAKNWGRVIDQVNKFIEEFMNYVLEKIGPAPPEVRRVLRRIAASAGSGEIATEAGFTGWTNGIATEAATTCFEAWIRERGGLEATDTRNAIRQVREMIAAHHGRFYGAEPVLDEHNNPIRERIANALGYWKRIDDRVVYLVNPDAFRNELCKGFHHLEVAKELYAKKALLKADHAGWTYRVRVTLPTGDEKNLWFYAITDEILALVK